MKSTLVPWDGRAPEHVAIIGAGPTGLGAAHRLQEIGYESWTLYEQEHWAGGLAASFVDEQHFTWDIGGHVQFSHYDYFDRLMEDLLGDRWYHLERESWVWMRERFVPYPFQNNLRHLPPDAMWDCVRGLIDVHRSNGHGPPANFAEWIRASFGEGIAEHFMLPYNAKVWAYPPQELHYRWVGDRVAAVDLERVLDNILHGKDEVSWGPNNRFRFPMAGGTGSIWRALAQRLPVERTLYGRRLTALDTRRRRLCFSDGSSEPYDTVVSTIPLDRLVESSDLHELKPAASTLRHSSSNIVGLGLRGNPSSSLRTKCWMYFPEPDIPFYRATVFSNYSPDHVPDIRSHWSLMFEVSESSHRPLHRADLVEQTIEGAKRARLIESDDQVASTWAYHAPYGYPTPSLQRDAALEVLLPALEGQRVFSRGRFGGWKYEVSNQDHSLMQGVECVNRLVFGTHEVTLPHPAVANGR